LFQVITPVFFAMLATIFPEPPVAAVGVQPLMVPPPVVVRVPEVQLAFGALADATPEAMAIEPSELTANIAATAATRADERNMESPPSRCV
jgi:hypothetical protein